MFEFIHCLSLGFHASLKRNFHATEQAELEGIFLVRNQSGMLNLDMYLPSHGAQKISEMQKRFLHQRQTLA